MISGTDALPSNMGILPLRDPKHEYRVSGLSRRAIPDAQRRCGVGPAVTGETPEAGHDLQAGASVREAASAEWISLDAIDTGGKQ
jgi:hypothetical protein